MAGRSVDDAPIIDSQGTQTDATTATVLATTGALAAGGNYEILVVAGCATNVARMQLEHRNTANDGNVSDVSRFRVPTDASVELRYAIYANVNESFRVMMTANHTGTSEATINVQRMY